jgi:hypothetical protein
MRFIRFNLMPWPYPPDDFRAKYRSAWVEIASSLYDPPISAAVELALLDVISRSGLMASFSVGLSIGHWFADERIPALLRVLRV